MHIKKEDYKNFLVSKIYFCQMIFLFYFGNLVNIIIFFFFFFSKNNRYRGVFSWEARATP